MFSETSCRLKRDLIQYYDFIKSEVDLIGQMQLVKMSTEFTQKLTEKETTEEMADGDTSNMDMSVEDCDDEKSHEEKRVKFLELYEGHIKKIDEALDQNLKEVNLFYEKQEIDENMSDEELKKIILKKDCLMIKTSDLNQTYSDAFNKTWFPFGILIFTDWYIDENQTKYFK
jgi:hypothetical protein